MRGEEIYSIERVVTERRAWNARVITLTVTVLSAVAACFGWIAGIPVTYTLAMGGVAVFDAGAYLLAHSGRERAGVLLLIGSTFVQHLLIVGLTGQLQTVPYMAAVGVLVAAATLQIRELAGVALLAVGVVVGEGFIVGYGATEMVTSHGYVVGALMLVALSFVLTAIQVKSADRAFQVAREREHAREQARREKEELERELEKSQRIEGLGRLAGSVAHDFNNLLGVIIGSADLALAELDSDHPARRELEEVLRTGDRATRLTRQLLTLTRSHVVPVEPLDVAAALAGMQPFLSRLAGAAVVVEVVADDDCPLVGIDSTQLEQLLSNYVVNARDAMPEGGTIRIELGAREITADAAESLSPGRYLELRVADEGTGIPVDVLPRLFEPFFTTKKAGTGLGLANCNAIATQLGGSIAISPRPEGGTLVRTLLPAHHEPPSSRPRSVPPSPPTTAGGARVLVVDDEETLRALARRILERAGLEVVEARNIAEAEKVVTDLSKPLHFVVLDVILGQERGPALLPLLGRCRPAARTVVTSAFVPERDLHETLEHYGVTFLAKPYARRGLLRALLGADADASLGTT